MRHVTRETRHGTAARVAGALLLAACAKGGAPSIQLGQSAVLSAPTAVGTAPMVAVGPGGAEAVAWVSAPNGGTDGRLYLSVNGAAPAVIRDSLGPVQAHGEFHVLQVKGVVRKHFLGIVGEISYQIRRHA